ncbi:MAG: glycosyltransferase family 9 protein [Chitinispirillaceae bacterium]
MEMPIIKALRHVRPDAHITALGAYPAIQLLDDNHVVNRLECVQEWGLTHWWDVGTEQIRNDIREWFDKEGFGLILDPIHTVRGVRDALMDSPVPVLDTKNVIQAFERTHSGLDAIKWAIQQGWGLSVPHNWKPSVYPRRQDHAFATALLAPHDGVRRKLIGVSPVASSALKRWPPRQLARLMQKIREAVECTFLLFCAPAWEEERQIYEPLLAVPGVIPIEGQHLLRVAALLKRCDLFIGNDTGLMHISSAVDTSVMAIFGPTDPSLYLPSQWRAHALAGKRPCPYRKSREFGPPLCIAKGECIIAPQSCIQDIDESEVIEKALSLLEIEEKYEPSERKVPMSPLLDRSPNRVLDLEELKQPEFVKVLDRLDRLLEDNTQLYLHPSKRWEYPWALQRAELQKQARVLDAGCGWSVFPLYLAQEGMKVSGCDVDIPTTDFQDLPLTYVRGDILDLPYHNDYFDAVFCISVIEHLGHDKIPQALDELRRVLRPGGKLLLTTDFYEDADEQLFYRGPGESFTVDWSFFDEKLLRKYILDANGFEINGDIDLSVNWDETKPRMRVFHGYPYTSVGIALVKKT